MPDAPPSLGPFRLTGTRHQSPAGEVLSAVDPDGRPATVVLLAAGPATDAAARDRFAAAVAGAARDGGVLLDASAAARPWAAFAGDPSRASSVLGAVLPSGAVGAAARGPGFEPYWRDRAGTWQPTPPAPLAATTATTPGDTTSTAKWIAAAVVGSIVLVLAGLLGWRTVLLADDDGEGAAAPPAASVLPTQPPVPDTPPGDPEEQQPEGQQQPQRPLETTGPGVAGPSFTPEDDTQVMGLPGLPFAFRVPGTWQCERSDDVPEPVVRYRCEDRSDPSEENPPGGVIEMAPCPQPCGSDAWEVLRARYAPLGAWRPVDAQTAVVEDLPAEVPGTYRIRMSRIFSTVPGSAPDSHVFVGMTGGPQDVETLQKVVNDIRANTS